MISRRREERTYVSVPIRIWGMDANGKPFSVPATTHDLTRFGARIMGVRVPLAAGEIVGVQHGSEKARFRVAWYGRPGSRLEGNVGVQALDWKKHIWGALVQDSVPTLIGNDALPVGSSGEPSYSSGEDPLLDRVGSDSASFDRAASDRALLNRPVQMPAPPSPSAIARLVAAERRLATRYDCSATVEVTVAQDGHSFQGTLREMSLVGCFIKTDQKLQQRTPINLVLRPFGMEIACRAQVRHIEDENGFGVKFTNFTEPAREALEQAIERLASESAVSVRQGAANPPSKVQQLSSAVDRLSALLREISSLNAKYGAGVDTRLVKLFDSQAEQTRQTASAIKQWLEVQQSGRETAGLRTEVENRRLRASTAVLRELLAETEGANFSVDNPAVAELYASAVAIYRRLAWLAERRNSVS
jgi:PilZ domain